MEDVHHVELAGGKSLTFEADPIDGMRLLLTRADGSLHALFLPFRSSGYGGATLLASPRGNLAVLAVYSGQGDIGYELLECAGDTLVCRAPLDDQQALLAEYAFSADQELLVTTLMWRMSEWWDGLDEYAEPAEVSDVSYGMLIVRDLEHDSETRHELRVEFARQGWEPDAPEETFAPPMRPALLAGVGGVAADEAHSPRQTNAATHLRFDMPWGPESLRLPLAPEVRVRMPHSYRGAQ